MIVSSLFSLLFACQNPPPVPGTLERTGEVLTTVNGQAITQGMVDGMLSQFPADVRDRVIAQGQTARLKDDLVTTELLYQKALEMKLHEKPDVKMLIAFSERQALARAVVEQVVAERTTDAAAKAWYDEHAVQFRRAQAKIRHIMVKDEAEANAVMAEIKGGADFAAVAAQKSLDTRTAKDGGSMGWVDVKNLGPDMAAAIAAATDGSLVGPVPSKGGFHVIQVESKREMVPMEEVMDQIKPKLREDLINAYLEELKKGATITAADAPAGGATVAPAAGAAPAAPA
ncbi:MAG TPA: peptidylprolyl isomerase, partial [Myxococcota bacterium]|nr:peptidylprolyl isomerase [Myxococcota bacterium]